MAAASGSPVAIGNQGEDVCEACGVMLHSVKSRRQCEKCNLICCISCYTLRLKLPESGITTDSRCSACEMLMKMQAGNREKTSAERKRTPVASRPTSPSHRTPSPPAVHNIRTDPKGSDERKNTAPSSKYSQPLKHQGRTHSFRREPFKEDYLDMNGEVLDDFGDVYGDSREDFGSFEDIPYAMILAGQVDPQKLMASQMKRMHTNAIRNPSSKKSSLPSVSNKPGNKNKNKNAGVTKRKVQSFNTDKKGASECGIGVTEVKKNSAGADSQSAVQYQPVDSEERHLTMPHQIVTLSESQNRNQGSMLEESSKIHLKPGKSSGGPVVEGMKENEPDMATAEQRNRHSSPEVAVKKNKDNIADEPTSVSYPESSQQTMASRRQDSFPSEQSEKGDTSRDEMPLAMRMAEDSEYPLESGNNTLSSLKGQSQGILINDTRFASSEDHDAQPCKYLVIISKNLQSPLKSRSGPALKEIEDTAERKSDKVDTDRQRSRSASGDSNTFSKTEESKTEATVTKPSSKNKNLLSAAQGDNTRLTGVDLRVASAEVKPKADKSSRKGDKSTDDVEKPVRRNVLAGKPSQELSEARHRAFTRIRQNVGAAGLKCSACGRPECEGHIMQKMKEMIKAAQDNGLEMRDVVPDGNCMFTAIVDQLQLKGDYSYDHKKLREAAVAWLLDNPCSEDGTPFASFLDESWDTYLARMIRDGQWGDHIILKAMVEVIQRSILVLNANASESHMTKFEPQKIKKESDGDSLILGHVGEFHYTSLRPAEYAHDDDDVKQGEVTPESKSADEGDIIPPDLEDLDMFEERQIDPVSKIPSPHLSFLMKTLVPISCLEQCSMEASASSAEVDERMASVSLQTKFVFVGPVAEGVCLRGLDRQIDPVTGATYDWDVSTTVSIQYDCRTVTKDDPERLPTDCLLEEDASFPGYAFVSRLMNMQYYGQCPQQLSNSSMRLGMQRGCITSYEAYRKMREKNCRSSRFSQSFFAIPVVSWPKSAESWKNRSRTEGWPEKAIINTVVLEGCLLFPDPHPFSPKRDLQWKMSFAVAEKRLFQEAVSPIQKHCYLIFKSLCNTQFRLSDEISDDHYKNIFFYSCERIPAEFWSSSPGACLLYMLDQFLVSLQQQRLDHYFIPEMNLLDTVSAETCYSLAHQLNNVRSQPILFLQQIYEKTMFVFCGDTLFDRVQDDIISFNDHRTLRLSCLEVFVPTSILIAQEHIRHSQYKAGYEVISRAFEDRLAVSTCDDTVPFSLFLNSALSGLNLGVLVWFCVYADKHLGGQLPGSLSRELCRDMTLLKIGEILPKDVAGAYAESEIPMAFVQSVCMFCNDFSIFLYYCGSSSLALKPLFFCQQKYKEKMKQKQQMGAATVAKATGFSGLGLPGYEEDFSDIQMFQIYVGFHFLYDILNQNEVFRSLLPEIVELCDRLNNVVSYAWLVDACKYVRDVDYYRIAEEKYNSVSSVAPDQYMTQCLSQLIKWKPNN